MSPPASRRPQLRRARGCGCPRGRRRPRRLGGEPRRPERVRVLVLPALDPVDDDEPAAERQGHRVQRAGDAPVWPRPRTAPALGPLSASASPQPGPRSRSGRDRRRGSGRRLERGHGASLGGRRRARGSSRAHRLRRISPRCRRSPTCRARPPARRPAPARSPTACRRRRRRHDASAARTTSRCELPRPVGRDATQGWLGGPPGRIPTTSRRPAGAAAGGGHHPAPAGDHDRAGQPVRPPLGRALLLGWRRAPITATSGAGHERCDLMTTR